MYTPLCNNANSTFVHIVYTYQHTCKPMLCDHRCVAMFRYTRSNTVLRTLVHTHCGARLWPRPGFMNDDESNGWVAECKPAQRCVGGPQRLCAIEYQGPLCSRCRDGDINARVQTCGAWLPSCTTSCLHLSQYMRYSTCKVKSTVHIVHRRSCL